MTEFTPFQILTERQATHLLHSYGRRFEERNIKPFAGDESEIYVSEQISGTDITVYIYEDEVHFNNRQVDVRFERPDYDSDEKMVEAFIDRLSEYLDRMNAESADVNPEPKTSSWIGELAKELWGWLFARR